MWESTIIYGQINDEFAWKGKPKAEQSASKTILINKWRQQKQALLATTHTMGRSRPQSTYILIDNKDLNDQTFIC